MGANTKPQYLAPSPSAAVAISRGEALKFDGSGNLTQAGAGERAIGFADADAALNAAVSVAIAGGGAVAIAGGTIAAGAALKSDASGHLVATTTTDDLVIAYAVESAVDNDVFAILPTHPSKY